MLSAFGDEQMPLAEQLAHECATHGAPASVHALDVRSDASCDAFVQAALALHGRIDALVHCAATTRFIPHADFDTLTPDEFHRTYDVNTVGAWRMVRACRSALQASGNGSVVLVSSIGGQLGRGSSVAYAASKGALNTLTLALARAMAPTVRVNAIAPGFVVGGLPSRVLTREQHADLERAQAEAAVLRRVSFPEEVATLALFLTDRAPAMTGQVVAMDNGLHLNAG